MTRNIRQGMHPNLPPHLQGLRGGLMATEWASGRNVQRALDLDSTLSVQGLGAASQGQASFDSGWYRSEDIRTASAPIGAFPAGSFVRLTPRTDGSGVEYVAKDPQGHTLYSGVTSGLTVTAGPVSPPFEGGNGLPGSGALPFMRMDNPWVWVMGVGGLFVVGGAIFLATR